MRKITDERLKLKNLRDIRILFLVENVGIIGILGYDLVTQGMEEMTDNPLWFVFIMTGVVSAYLSISIGVDHESSEKSPKKGLITSIIVSALTAIGLGIFVSFTGDIITGVFIGVIVFICFLIPSLYVYYLRIKLQD